MDIYSDARRDMVAQQLKKRGIKDPLILKAMLTVPRHEFVPHESQRSAYYDGPLLIGCSQTISQPYMVAVMTEALLLKGGEKVMEVGTGSGYQAAVLAEICNKVYSVERHAALAERADKTLKEQGYHNIHVLVGDGTLGLPHKAPFDGIIVTAGAPYVPESLKEQLAEGGRLVIPVGGRMMQSLVRITRRGETFDEENLLGCVFVPLIGKKGWQSGENY
ncbi:MAG: protein-L-isoaspartate(D-aspartate) O-methyltransferase [Deltaproteobacteria bacterium]|nr:protein-L-isoaspartate(D-aspartate) O-methyltransferase [Deltaproteobacteria bacterium]